MRDLLFVLFSSSRREGEQPGATADWVTLVDALGFLAMAEAAGSVDVLLEDWQVSVVYKKK